MQMWVYDHHHPPVNKFRKIAHQFNGVYCLPTDKLSFRHNKVYVDLSVCLPVRILRRTNWSANILRRNFYLFLDTFRANMKENI